MDNPPLYQILEDEIQKEKTKENGMSEEASLSLFFRLRGYLFQQKLTKEEVMRLFTILPH